MTDTCLPTNLKILAPLKEPGFAYTAALYFLDGHYLFVQPQANGGRTSKFVTAADVAAAFSDQEEDTGWLPAGVVRAGRVAKGRFFVYSAPEQKVTITLEGDPAQVITIPIPRTVLLGVGSRYFLWALRTEHFDPTAYAYNAPFPNVYDGGGICWGSNNPPAADPTQARKVWELFFSTPFNAHLVGGKSAKHKNDIRPALAALANKRRYPGDDLVREGRQLDWLIKRTLED